MVDGTFSVFPLSTLNSELSTSSARRAQPNRYPDFGLNLAPAFPVALSRGQWLWEFVVRYSGVTVPDFHGVPRCLTVTQMDERPSSFKELELC